MLKIWYFKRTNKMAGASGHLNHIYDDRELTFRDIKKIFSLLSAGKLPVVEKIDGFNALLSYKNEQATLARNLGDIRSGGMTLGVLLERDFAGGNKVKNIYIESLKSFNEALSHIPKYVKKEMFQEGTVFYNADLFGPNAKNLLEYEKSGIMIHNNGHKQYIPETNEILTLNVAELSYDIGETLEILEKKSTKNNIPIFSNKVRDLNPLENDLVFRNAKISLEKLLFSSKTSESNTIEEYLKSKIAPYVEKRLPEVSEVIQNIVIENILGNEKLVLPKGSPRELKERITEIKKRSISIIQGALFPLEEIVTDFSTELLNGNHSVLINDHISAVKKYRQTINDSIEEIKSSGNRENINFLLSNMRKLKDLNRINTSMEGIVFEYKNKAYKMTGCFAPANQICGMKRFGREKNHTPIVEYNKVEQNTASNELYTGNMIAVVPGGFKPPHAGHYQVAKYLADIPEVTKVYIFVCPKERTGHSVDKRVVITKKVSIYLWKMFTQNDPKIEVMISKDSSPVKSAYDVMSSMNPGDTILFGLGKKDAQDDRFSKAQEWSDQNKLGVKVKIINTPMFSSGISGTELRNIIASDNQKLFKEYMPEHLSEEEKNTAWNIVNEQATSSIYEGAI